MGYTQKLGLLAQSVFQDSSLNVGIGAAPSGTYKFEVTGTAKVSGILTLGSTISNGTYTYTLPSVTGTLPVGTGPSGYLTKFTGTSAIGDSIINENSNEIIINSAFATLTLKGSRSYSIQSNDTSGNFRLIDNTAGLERLTITSVGNFGISTTSPVTTNLVGSMTIVKSYNSDTPTSTTAQTYYTNQSNLYLFGRNAGLSIISNSTTEEGTIFFGNASTVAYASIATGSGTSSVGGDMYFKVGSNTERMRITSAGNVGIGTSSPLGSSTEKTLHLSDGGAGYTTLYVTNGANSLRGVFAVANSISSISIGTQSNHNLNIITNDTVKAIVTANGEFGVGVTPTSGNRFWVKGNDSTSANSTCLLQNSDGGIIMFARNDGPVTKPLQPSFRAGRSSSYNPGANTTIVFNTTSSYGFNIGGNYNTGNGRFTAPIAGRYIFSTCIIWQSVSSGQSMDDAFTINVNGTTGSYSWRRASYVVNYTGIGGYYTDFGTFMFNLSAGDYVEIVNRYDLTVHGNLNYTWFAGYLLG